MEKIYKEIEKTNKAKISYVLSQYIVDYINNSTTFKNFIFYDAEGNLIDNFTFRDFELRYDAIFPNSNGEYWADLARSPRKLKKIYKLQQEQ